MDTLQKQQQRQIDILLEILYTSLITIISSYERIEQSSIVKSICIIFLRGWYHHTNARQQNGAFRIHINTPRRIRYGSYG